MTIPRPVYSDPDCEPLVPSVGWDLSDRCRITFNLLSRFRVIVSTSGEEQELGLTVRTVTADQIRDYAHKLLALIGDEDTP